MSVENFYISGPAKPASYSLRIRVSNFKAELAFILLSSSQFFNFGTIKNFYKLFMFQAAWRCFRTTSSAVYIRNPIHSKTWNQLSTSWRCITVSNMYIIQYDKDRQVLVEIWPPKDLSYRRSSVFPVWIHIQCSNSRRIFELSSYQLEFRMNALLSNSWRLIKVYIHDKYIQWNLNLNLKDVWYVNYSS